TGDLEIAGITQAGGGEVTVTTDGEIAITGTIETTDTVELVSTSTITETGAGRIAASALAAQSTGGLALGGDNQIGQITAMNTSGGSIAITNAGTLEIAGITQVDDGDMSVTNDGGIAITGTIETADSVELVSTATISESGAGRIAASALAAQS